MKWQLTYLSFFVTFFIWRCVQWNFEIDNNNNNQEISYFKCPLKITKSKQLRCVLMIYDVLLEKSWPTCAISFSSFGFYRFSMTQSFLSARIGIISMDDEICFDGSGRGLILKPLVLYFLKALIRHAILIWCPYVNIR